MSRLYHEPRFFPLIWCVKIYNLSLRCPNLTVSTWDIISKKSPHGLFWTLIAYSNHTWCPFLNAFSASGLQKHYNYILFKGFCLWIGLNLLKRAFFLLIPHPCPTFLNDTLTLYCSGLIFCLWTVVFQLFCGYYFFSFFYWFCFFKLGS